MSMTVTASTKSMSQDIQGLQASQIALWDKNSIINETLKVVMVNIQVSNERIDQVTASHQKNKSRITSQEKKEQELLDNLNQRINALKEKKKALIKKKDSSSTIAKNRGTAKKSESVEIPTSRIIEKCFRDKCVIELTQLRDIRKRLIDDVAILEETELWKGKVPSGVYEAISKVVNIAQIIEHMPPDENTFTYLEAVKDFIKEAYECVKEMKQGMEKINQMDAETVASFKGYLDSISLDAILQIHQMQEKKTLISAAHVCRRGDRDICDAMSDGKRDMAVVDQFEKALFKLKDELPEIVRNDTLVQRLEEFEKIYLKFKEIYERATTEAHLPKQGKAYSRERAQRLVEQINPSILELLSLRMMNNCN